MTGRVAVLGEPLLLSGFALAGAVAVPAETEDDVRAAWAALDPDIVLVLLTQRAADALAPRLDDAGATRLAAVLPV